MRREDKELLLKDLSARLPYGVKINLNGGNDIWTLKGIFEGDYTGIMLILGPSFSYENITPATSNWSLSLCKPYLRPMSSMTEEEKDYVVKHSLGYTTNIGGGKKDEKLYFHFKAESYDWLNKNMFDFRGLIPKGLALSTDLH